MVEIIGKDKKDKLGDKEVVDIRPQDKEKEEKVPTMFFTVSLVTKERPIHVLVKAESAIDALEFVQKVEKAPAVGVHITEYSKYYDSTVL